MRVIKRNGKSENINFNKISTRIKRMMNINDIKINLDSNLIAQKIISFLKDNIQTAEIDEISARIMASTIDYNYQIMAGRVIISNHHKKTLDKFSDRMRLLHNDNIISNDFYNIVESNKEFFDNLIDYNKDFLFDYFGFKTLEKIYLLKDKTDKIIERPQDIFMRVSIALYDNNLELIQKNYEYMSNLNFTHATPTLFNAGTNFPQYASCFLLQNEDSIDGIYKCISDCAKISKWSGGLGVGISDIRCNGSKITSTNGKTNGIIPMLKVFNETALYVNQGGKRNGSIAIYLEPHHGDFMKFLDLKKNHGDEFERARDLFLAVWLSDLFMERVKNNDIWSFMDPKICPNLTNVYGKEYKTLYEEYEKKGMFLEQVFARDVLIKIVSSQLETGLPYIMNKDIVNYCSNQKNIGVIKSSNLCSEITLFSSPEEYAVCTLASISLPNCIIDQKFNFEKLGEITCQLVRNLNKIIDKNFYPIEETRRSNLKHRPLGIGVQGLADTFMKLKISYDSEEANKLNKYIFETIYYWGLYESNILAQTDGKYETFDDSPLSKGLFHFQLFDECQNTNTELSGMWDFDELRKSISKDGVRNSTITSLMPTASTSQLLGNVESFEAITANIFTRNTIAGDFIIVNKYLLKDLQDLNLWSNELKNKIINLNGSIQEISEIPDKIKKIYKTSWDFSQKVIIDLSADRTPFICQSQSLNLYHGDANAQKLYNALMYGYNKGLKTLVYYTRTMAKTSAIKFTSESCDSCSG